jgi:hypothetical protein
LPGGGHGWSDDLENEPGNEPQTGNDQFFKEALSRSAARAGPRQPLYKTKRIIAALSKQNKTHTGTMAEGGGGGRDMMGSKADMISSKMDAVSRNEIWREHVKKEDALKVDAAPFQVNSKKAVTVTGKIGDGNNQGSSNLTIAEQEEMLVSL